MIKKFSKKIKSRQKTRTTAQNKKQKSHYSIHTMFNTFPFGRWPVAFDALSAFMGSNASRGRGFGGGGPLILFGFGSVWLRDLSMQLCFGFALMSSQSCTST